MPDCSRRSFLGGAACLGLAGCVSPGGLFAGDRPNLRFGVLSDIHVTDWASTEVFRKALRYFRDRGVDAVMIAGDLADHGLLPQLENVAGAWYEVFPDDRGPDGRKVEKLFIYGNHDPEGLSYRDAPMERAFKAMHLTYAEAEKLTLTALGLGKCWEKCFHEAYSPIYVKNVRGYDFIGGHWDRWDGIRGLEDWWKANVSRVDTAKPFFYFQHCAPRNTVYGADSWGDDAGQSVRCLAPYANAVAFSGHSHLPLTDGRSCWRGEFTSISASTLSYVCMPAGCESAPDYRRNLDCRQGQLVSVFDDRLEIERRDFVHDEPLDADLVLEMPAAVSSFGVRAVAVRNLPAFPAGARIRAIADGDALEISFPGAFANPTARPFRYRVVVECARGKGGERRRVVTRWFQTDAAFSRARAENRGNFVSIPLSRLPADAVQALVRITPENSYGGCGGELVSDFIQLKV